MEHENVCDTNCKRALSTVTKGLVKELGKMEIRTRGEYHPNDSTVKNEQNTEKSPGDLRRLAAHSNPK